MGLMTYVIRRLILLIPVLIGVSILVFAVSMLIPPTSRAALYARSANEYRHLGDLVEKYGLNDPFYVQYFRWMSQVLQGNLGWSHSDRRPVLDSIVARFPVTFEIVLYSAPITIFAGIYLGIISAVHKDTIIDHITRSLSIIGWSLPSFWLGLILLSYFYAQLGWCGGPGRLSYEVYHGVVTNSSTGFVSYTNLNTIDGLLNGRLDVTVDAFKHLILPIIVLVVIQIALLIRVMRSSMLEALSKGYVITARAKGLSPKEVINKHARRNALIPVITLSGLLIAGMMTGLVITETVFAIAGLGRWAAQSAIRLDIVSVLGFSLFVAVVYVLANLIVDILYAYIDPRIRLV